MDNPEKLATLATHDTRRRQTKTKTHHNTENYKDEQHRPHKNTGGEPVCSCLVISTSHKLLVKKKSYLKAYRLSEMIFVYSKGCQYSMFYTNWS
jgi:hypothetical protein